MWTCPASHCGFKSPERLDECPKCGIIVRKLFQIDVREGLAEESLLLKYQLTPAQFPEWMGSVPADYLSERDSVLGQRSPVSHKTAQVVRGGTAYQSPVRRPKTSEHKIRYRGIVILSTALLALAVVGVLVLNRQGPVVTGQEASSAVENHETVTPAPPPPVIIPEPVVYPRTYPGRIVQQVDEIAKKYKLTHTYSIQDMFVCVEMSIDIWNQLITNNIRAYLRAGNPEVDLRGYKKFSPEYYQHINHVWVMFQAEGGEHIPLETTGGYVVTKNHPQFSLYMEGIDFENPKKLRTHLEIRSKMGDACKEAKQMSADFNRVYGGKRKTQESLLEKGKVDQKVQDCKRLTEEFKASMR
jgi:hypothetical protein